jgi:proliferating cell nuclear antigen
MPLFVSRAEQDRISDFELKLMVIETEHLGIPAEQYKCTITMPSAEFQRIIRDLQVIGETCKFDLLVCIFFKNSFSLP